MHKHDNFQYDINLTFKVSHLQKVKLKKKRKDLKLHYLQRISCEFRTDNSENIKKGHKSKPNDDTTF